MGLVTQPSASCIRSGPCGRGIPPLVAVRAHAPWPWPLGAGRGEPGGRLPGASATAGFHGPQRRAGAAQSRLPATAGSLHRLGVTRRYFSHWVIDT